MNSPDGVAKVKQCSYSPRAGYGPSAAIRIPSSISVVCSYHISGDPYDSAGIHRSMCHRSTGKYFGTRRVSITSRITFPFSSRSVHRPPIQVSLDPPHTTRKFASPYKLHPPATLKRSPIPAGASCVSRVTRIVEAALIFTNRKRKGRAPCARPSPFPFSLFYLPPLVAGRNRQVINIRTAARRFVPHLKPGDEVKDIRRRNSAAGPVNRKHRLTSDIVEIDVLHHRPSPV